MTRIGREQRRKIKMKIRKTRVWNYRPFLVDHGTVYPNNFFSFIHFCTHFRQIVNEQIMFILEIFHKFIFLLYFLLIMLMQNVFHSENDERLLNDSLSFYRKTENNILFLGGIFQMKCLEMNFSRFDSEQCNICYPLLDSRRAHINDNSCKA